MRRSAISSTLGVLGNTKFSSSLLLSRAIRGMGFLSVKIKKRIPEWDNRVILTHLLSKEFKPLHLVSLRNLTLKTCLLITLATWRRASEVLNLSGIPGDIAYERDNTVSLSFLRNFWRRTNVLIRHLPLFKSVLSLTSWIGGNWMLFTAQSGH